MAHGTVGFFEPADPSLGLDSSWEFQDGGGKSTSSTRDQDLGKDGDEIGSALHDKKTTTTFQYVHKGTGANYVWPNVGAVAGGWHIDSFRCRWDRNRKRAHLEVSCHRHEGGAATPHADCRTYVPSLDEIPVPSFGCPAVFGDAFALDESAVVDIREATYTVECSHVDELGRSGEELKGNNYDGKETLEVSLTGAATADDYDSSWDNPDSGDTPSNSGATTSSFTFEHHIAHYVANSNP